MINTYFAFVCAWIWASSLSLAADLTPPGAVDGPEYLLSAGDVPVLIADKGFSMIPPAGWTYATNYPGLTLVMQAPEAKDDKYRRTIQVTSFDGPMIISDLNVESFQASLVKKFTETNSSVADYNVRNHLPVDLESGLKAHLFYTEFKVDGSDLMQMHVVVSADDRHFVVSYTDLAKFFDVNDSPSEHLNEAWAAANTVKLERPAVSFAEKLFSWAIYGGVLAGIAFAVFYWRRRERLKSYQNLEVEAQNTDPKTIFTGPESMTPQSLSAVKITQFGGTKHGDAEDDEVVDSADLDFDAKQPPVKKAG